MKFTWNETKAIKVKSEHSINFANIIDIFEDPFAVEFIDEAHSTEEEIRYAIIPFETHKETTKIPHVDFMRVVTSTATNDDENAVVSVHAVEEQVLKEHFNADWGSMAYYQPKSRFSTYKHGRLLSLFTEGTGTVDVFFLFDEASRALDNRLHLLQFQTKI
mgnify:CR=1 FL=1